MNDHPKLPMPSTSKLLIAGGATAILLTTAAWLTMDEKPTPSQKEQPDTNLTSSKQGRSELETPTSGLQTSSGRIKSGKEDEDASLELTSKNIEDFLRLKDRSATALLSAYQHTGDENLLREAQERFPEHPHVLAVSMRAEESPEKQLEHLEKLKRVDPENGMTHCVAAHLLLKLGRKEEALEELRGFGNKEINDFVVDMAWSATEALSLSGKATSESLITTLYGASNPTIIQVRNLSNQLSSLSDELAAGGDPASAEEIRAIHLQIGKQLQQGTTVIDQLIGAKIEINALLQDSSPEAPARIEQIDQMTKSLMQDGQQVSELLLQPGVSEVDRLLYIEHMREKGEPEANRWLLEKYPAR